MRHLKTYENMRDIEVGDYIIADISNRPKDIRDFLKNNIGQVIGISDDHPIMYLTQYDNLSHIFYGDVTDIHNRISFFFNEILHKSKNKKDLEIYLDSNKYNL